MKKDRTFLYAAGTVLFFILAFFSVFAGTKGLGFHDGMNAFLGFVSGKQVAAGTKIILLNIRLPRFIGAVLCGAALSVSGLILQTSLNNTLASPGIIGINSGAGFLVLFVTLLFPFSAFAKTLGAFTGAVISVLIVYLISERAGISKTTLILAGVAVSSLMSAGIDVVITMHPEIVADKVAFSLGGFQNLNISSLYFSAPIIFAGIVALIFLSGGIDLFALGDDAAYGLGLNVRFYRVAVILISGVLAGCAVSVCGLLGFVGLIIPNFIRMIGKNNARTNIILCVIFGSDFLMLCDLVSRLLFYPYELPVGLFLSCLGSPFFIWMLISKRKKLAV
ncbi:MAG: iron ABC transporter permease [Treponema sp.]|nr:iron ABC transporter permease [Treponema sp.]